MLTICFSLYFELDIRLTALHVPNVDLITENVGKDDLSDISAECTVSRDPSQ